MAGLRHVKGSAVLAVAVDMPGILNSDIECLIRSRNPAKAATAYRNPATGKPEPLFCIWEPECLEGLVKQASGGNFSPLDFLISNPVQLITAENNGLFINLNTPEDLEHWRKNKSDSTLRS